MFVTCNDEYWAPLGNLKPDTAPCGKTYDDAEHLTYCPHDPLPPKLSEEELQRLFDSITIPEEGRQ